MKIKNIYVQFENEQEQKPFNILKINNLNSMNKNHLIFLIINNNEQKLFNTFNN